jgi:tetratricopeptide (TPR) repeat protein
MVAPQSPVDLIEESFSQERKGKYALALKLARQALEQARSAEIPLQIAAALKAIGRIRFRLGQYQAVKSAAKEALSLAPPESPERADALMLMGMQACEALSLVEAEHFYRQAADLGREIGYELVRLRALHNLASGVYLPRGQFELALDGNDYPHVS